MLRACKTRWSSVGCSRARAARLAAERLESVDELEPLDHAVTDLELVLHQLSPESLLSYVEVSTTHSTLLSSGSRRAPTLARAISVNAALPFAAPRAPCCRRMRPSALPGVLIVAQYQHRALVNAVGARHGGRTKEVLYEHARLAQLNLELAGARGSRDTRRLARSLAACDLAMTTLREELARPG